MAYPALVKHKVLNTYLKNDCSSGSSFGIDVKRKLHQLLIDLQKHQMLYFYAGAPTSLTSYMAGCFCIDTTNDDLYVCTDRSTPTWTKIAE